MHLVETMKQYLGWCPDRSMAQGGNRNTWREVKSRPLPTKGSFVEDGVLIDFGSTGTSRLYNIVFAAGIVGVVLLLSLVRMADTSLAGILLCGLILLAAIVFFYWDMKKATVEITQDSLNIRRILWWSVVIPKDTIASVEVRDNIPPIPLWLQKALFLFVIPVSSVCIGYGQYLQLASGAISLSSFFLHLGFEISIVLFFLVMYYHSRIRSYYSSVIVITTTTKKRAGVYVKNPEEIAGMLGKSA